MGAVSSCQPDWADFITAPKLSFLQIMHLDMLPFLMKHVNWPPINRGQFTKGREELSFPLEITEDRLEGQAVPFFKELNFMPIEICV